MSQADDVRARAPGADAAPAPHLVLVALSFPLIVWGADELRRYLVRRTRPS
jgi:hypothetical protein